MHAMMFIIIKRHHCFFQGRDSTQLENVDCLVGKEKQRLAVSHRSADRLPSYISLPRHTKQSNAGRRKDGNPMNWWIKYRFFIFTAKMTRQLPEILDKLDRIVYTE